MRQSRTAVTITTRIIAARLPRIAKAVASIAMRTKTRSAVAAPAPAPASSAMLSSRADEARSAASSVAGASARQVEDRTSRDAEAAARAPQAGPVQALAKRAAAQAELQAQTPERELERIAELRQQARHDEADKALAEFRKRYPEFKIAEEMRARGAALTRFLVFPPRPAGTPRRNRACRTGPASPPGTGCGSARRSAPGGRDPARAAGNSAGPFPSARAGTAA